MLDELEGPGGRASREFRQKFPDEIVTDNLGGQLWFGAECLAAGSSIMNKVVMELSVTFRINLRTTAKIRLKCKDSISIQIPSLKVITV